MPYSLRYREPDRVARRNAAERSPAVKVEADWDACEANAVCAGLVPQVFEVDDEDNLNILVDVIPENLVDGVRHAVRSCPKAALRLSE
jgi:ferredoxin